MTSRFPGSWLAAAACTVALAAPASAQGVADAGASAQDQPADQLVPPTSAQDFTADQLDRVLAGRWRPDVERARDRYRHPKQTLQFLGVRPDQTVVEITPGGGWYSAILAPLLRDNGQYVAAVAAPPPGKPGSTSLQRRFAADATAYGRATIVTFDPKAPVLGAPGSADVVLTFRNVHNWVMADTAPAMFKAFYNVLRPGGVLGVVDHRAADGTALAKVKSSGYLPTASVVKLATDAGFTLEGTSEINANPADTKDYAEGVWTLPPTLTLGDVDRAKYQAIGESDRMTLRFVKPDAPAASSSVQ
ncbi:methyltransferase [Dyella sp.]|jgi:predicted methyltransferase|uniref:class I SAM-dependent methyltransferase n=1 Tax=Dyella sp. TaxID=1869338 RepID=UPI002D78735A|nr:methyltransferase [Dyella sp.]HET6431335.1 methyltransferase [Dyella sp.]